MTTKNKVYTGSCFAPAVHTTIGLGAWFSNVWAWNRDFHQMPDEEMPGWFDSFVDAVVQRDPVSWGDADATITYYSTVLNEVFQEWFYDQESWHHKELCLVLPIVDDEVYGINYEDHRLYNFGEPRFFGTVRGELAVYNENEEGYVWHNATYVEDNAWKIECDNS